MNFKKILDSKRIKDDATNGSLVSSDGMIHMYVPPTYKTQVSCKPLGNAFYDEDAGGTILMQFCEYPDGQITTALRYTEVNEGYSEWADDYITEGINDAYISEPMREEMERLGIGYNPETGEYYWLDQVSDSKKVKDDFNSKSYYLVFDNRAQLLQMFNEAEQAIRYAKSLGEDKPICIHQSNIIWTNDMWEDLMEER
jgi:hypothetical protein